MIKESPNIGNINEIYEDESSTLVLPSRTNNVSKDIIAEEEEGEEMEGTIDTKDRDDIKRIAIQLFNQEYTEVQISQYTSVLGKPTSRSKLICEEFMVLFKPWPKSLVLSLRKLCTKLYLLGESTQIDQILEIFSINWIESNSEEIFGDYKTVHIINFALLMLNSDLNNHNNDSRYDLLTKEEFIKNIWVTLEEDKTVTNASKESIQSELSSYYDAICTRPLELLKIPSAQPLLQRKNPLAVLRSFSTSSNVSTSPKPLAANNSYSNISMLSQKNHRRFSSFSSSLSLNEELMNKSDLSEINYDVEYLKDKYDDKLEKLGPPWLVEGILKSEIDKTSKYLKSSNSKRVSNLRVTWFAKLTNTSIISSDLDIYNTKGWKKSIVTIQRGLLKQYSFGSVSNRKNFIKTRSTKFADTIITYNLYSAVATLVDDKNQIISNSAKKTEGIAWVLTIPNIFSNEYNDEKKIVYYAPSLEIATNFIETCNFWAARITSIPSTDDKIVTNIEYGWSDEVIVMREGFQDIKLGKWTCLLSIESSFIPSAYTLTQQFDNLKIYVEYLTSEIIKHNELKPVLKRVWGKDSKSLQLVMNNWGEKYAHLLKQHEKFKTYLDSLATVVSFKPSNV